MAVHTRCWNAVPRMSSGRSSPCAGASMKPTTLATSCSNLSSPPTRRAFGKRACRLRTSALGSSANSMAHTPFALAATRSAPSEHRTERALPNGKADEVAAAASAELRRRHAEQTGRGGIEAAVGVEARAIDRLGDGIAGGELLAHPLAAMAGGIGFRRHPGHLLE